MKKSLLLHVFGKSHSPEVVIPVAVVVQPGKAAVAVGSLPPSPGHEYPPARLVVGVGDGLTGGLVMLPHQPTALVVSTTPVSRIPL